MHKNKLQTTKGQMTMINNWTLREDNYGDGLPIVHHDGTGWKHKQIDILRDKKRVCSVNWMSHNSIYAAESIEEMRSLANLIKAAPKLLSALKNLLNPHYGDIEGILSEKEARAAIKEAEGE